jgi:hypothetical protein
MPELHGRDPNEGPPPPSSAPARPAGAVTDEGAKRYDANLKLIRRRLADEDRMNEVRRARKSK